MTDSEKLDLVLEKVTNLENDLQEVKQRVNNNEFFIENEIRPNIIRVAEGHLDLSRRLADYIKVANDVQAKQVVQDIYIRMNDVKLKTL